MTCYNSLYFAAKVTESDEEAQRTTEMDINCITHK